MITKSSKKEQKKYSCEKCHYTSSKKYNLLKHFSTTKHKMVTNDNKKEQKVATFVCNCGKVYKFRSGLSRHKKNCCSENMPHVGATYKTVSNLDKTGDNPEILEICKTMKVLLEDNRRTTELMGKVLDQNSKLIPKVGNNNNNKISINVFLNEQCKDAMNLKDFIDNLKVSLEDLDYTKNNGFVKGISNIFVKHLTDLEPTERPIHCSDKKRLQFYVKDKDTWQKDDAHKQINESIHSVTVKQIHQVKEWENLHPNYLVDPDLTQEWHAMIQKIMGGANDKERNKNTENIKKGISESVDVKNAMK